MGGQRPRQADLKRAVSTAYYALFHMLCRTCADCFIGGKNADRSRPAWVQAYRVVDHGTVVRRCRDGTTMQRFPQPIQDFALQFVDAQVTRHNADYDPTARFTKSEVLAMIDAAETALRGFAGASVRDRRAFAAWVALAGRR